MCVCARVCVYAWMAVQAFQVNDQCSEVFFFEPEVFNKFFGG